MNTQNFFFMVLGSVVLIVFVGGAVVFSFLRAQPEVGTSSYVLDPFGFDIISNKPPEPNTNQHGEINNNSATTSLINVSTFNRAPLTVRDFTKDADVVRVVARDQEQYYSLGSLPYGNYFELATTSDVPLAQKRGYEIIYYPVEQSFSVLILSEPLGETRRSATNDLAVRLNISAQQLCAILVDVLISTDNAVYGGKRVGLSGCMGAVKFPGD